MLFLSIQVFSVTAAHSSAHTTRNPLRRCCDARALHHTPSIRTIGSDTSTSFQSLTPLTLTGLHATLQHSSYLHREARSRTLLTTSGSRSTSLQPYVLSYHAPSLCQLDPLSRMHSLLATSSHALSRASSLTICSPKDPNFSQSVAFQAQQLCRHISRSLRSFHPRRWYCCYSSRHCNSRCSIKRSPSTTSPSTAAQAA
jgi:hypothetical protein